MPPGPLPLAPLGHPGGLPLRRSACSGQSGLRRTFAPLRSPFRPRALARWSLAVALGPGSLRAPPGVRRRVPLRLSGSAYRGRRRPPSGAPRPPAALAAGRPAGRPGSGPLASPGVPPVALGLLRALPCAPLRAPSAPGGCSLRRGPPGGRGSAPLRSACPPGSRPGPLAALAGRFLRPPAPGVWGLWGPRLFGGFAPAAAGAWHTKLIGFPPIPAPPVPAYMRPAALSHLLSLLPAYPQVHTKA